MACPALAAFAKQRARVGRGEARLEVRLGGQPGIMMRRELAAEEKTELLAEFQAFAFECGVLTGGAAKVDQAQCAGTFAEVPYGEHKVSAALFIDPCDAANEIAPIAPGFETQRAVRGVEREVVPGDANQLFTGSGECRLGPGGNEELDGFADFCHYSANWIPAGSSRRVGGGGLR